MTSMQDILQSLSLVTSDPLSLTSWHHMYEQLAGGFTWEIGVTPLSDWTTLVVCNHTHTYYMYIIYTWHDWNDWIESIMRETILVCECVCEWYPQRYQLSLSHSHSHHLWIMIHTHTHTHTHTLTSHIHWLTHGHIHTYMHTYIISYHIYIYIYIYL